MSQSQSNEEIRAGQYRRKRYHSDGDIPDIDEVSDPSVREDETSRSLGEWFEQNKWFVLASGFFGMIGVVLLMIYGSRYVPHLIHNQAVQFVAKYGSVIAVFYSFGWKNHQSTRDNRDWLVLMTEDEVIRFFGKFEDGLFHPIKGFKWLGHSEEYYTIGDLDPEIVETLASLNRSKDDRVKIRLHPAMMDITQTEMGTVVAQLSAGLTADPWGRESNVVAELPEMADKSRMSEMKEEMKNLHENWQESDKRADMFKTQRDAAIEEAQANHDEVIDKFVRRYSKVKNAEGGQAPPMPATGGGGMMPMEEEIEEEFEE